MRKRVIVGGDTSTANSGFAIYKKHLLKGLFDSNLFEVAEVGNGGYIEDKQRVPWKYYPTGVKPGDPRYQQYISNPSNEYGTWRWDRIALGFRPHVVVSPSDCWQFAHETTSPLRPYYHWMISPTVDSLPQRIDFMQIYAQADTLLAYTDWARKYLVDNRLPCLDYIGMGIDPDVMKPVDDKKTLRRKYNLPEDAIIFGFVARNQMRKRFPDIIESFALYLKKVHQEIADRSYLLLHTSHIDQGFDLVIHMLENRVINKVLFTYFCQQTGKTFVSTFHGERSYSPYSRNLTAVSPNVVHSPTDIQLNEVYNLMDYYMQPATCFDGQTSIFTMEGWKNIADINEGEYVYTHKNRFRKVLTRFENKAPKTILKIQCYGNTKPLLVTEDHPLFAYTKEKTCPTYYHTVRSYLGQFCGHGIKRGKELPQYTVEYAVDLKVGDMLVSPIGIQPPVMPDTSFGKIDEDFCTFMGLFAADGCASTDGVKITCNKDEEVNINLATNILNTFGNVKIREYKGRNAVDVRISSLYYTSLFREVFYNENKEKRLPSWYIGLPQNMQKQILVGLFMGDGCDTKRANKYQTTSPILAEQTKHLLINNGYLFNAYIWDRSKQNRKTMYGFEVNTKFKKGETEYAQHACTKNLVINNQYLSNIKSIEQIEYNEEKVYTLEVEEDHTYTTCWGWASNCEGEGYPQIEAAANNLPIIATGYSAMEELTTKFGGLLVKPGTLNYEHGVMARRASMNIESWADAMVKYALEKPKVNSREIVLQKYTWKHIVDKWIYYIERADMPKLHWDAPIRQFAMPPLQGDMTITQFIHSLSSHIPHIAWGVFNLMNMRGLNNQMELHGKQILQITPEVIAKRYEQMVNNINACEQARVGQIKLEPEDYLA